MKLQFRQLVLQPTTLCNLDCQYCYLPERNRNQRMPVLVAERIADSLSQLPDGVTVSWHAGEPLSTGFRHFSALLGAFAPLNRSRRIAHVIQTNATLLDEHWIRLLKSHDVAIGVSIDGPGLRNRNRVDWRGRPAFERAMQGIGLLRANRIDFTAIAVVDADSLTAAHEIYAFFVELGCASLGLNFEEQVGTHTRRLNDSSGVRRFWSELFAAWRANPAIDVREFSQLLSWMHSVSEGRKTDPDEVEIFPCIAHNGDVALLSPEFLGARSDRYSNFVVGNILHESLAEIIARCQSVAYVSDYLHGVDRCRVICPYFSACGGVSAANKFFETGSTDATETTYCINSTQEPLNALLAHLN